MSKIAIIRCEKNENSCPLTTCFNCMANSKEAFDTYDESTLAGVFTCRCPGDSVENLAKILKAKGADAIHFCTCLFSKKTPEGWVTENGGFCDKIDGLMEKAAKATGLPCIKGTAHLPKGYEPETF
jgi:predicted metal-binding protein